jgi:hypothetical protein
MDLHENTETKTVTATFELPGIKQEDINVEVHGNRLTISGESKRSDNYNKGSYVVQERSYGKFSRSLQIPQGIKVSTLTMRIPCSDMVLMVIVLCRLRMSTLRWRMECLPCGSRRLDQTSNPSGLRSHEDAVISTWPKVSSFQICIISRLRRRNNNSVSYLYNSEYRVHLIFFFPIKVLVMCN